jgi:hypothetical protein
MRLAKEIRIRVQIYEFQYEFAAYFVKWSNGHFCQPSHNQVFAGTSDALSRIGMRRANVLGSEFFPGDVLRGVKAP